jgi:hypothetical protein
MLPVLHMVRCGMGEEVMRYRLHISSLCVEPARTGSGEEEELKSQEAVSTSPGSSTGCGGASG